MKFFKCVHCGRALEGFIPNGCVCGYKIPVTNDVYQFTEDMPIYIEGDGLKWLGYEKVGMNYEPGYFYRETSDTIGDSTKLMQFMGSQKVVLDIGAGLGVSSISFAKAGLRVIAADISQAMLEVAVDRLRKHNIPKDGMLCARMNGYKLEMDDHCMDGVLAVDVLHQVDRPDLMMNEIVRVLKHDGYFMQYGPVKSLGYNKEQQVANRRYTDAYKDISNYYNHYIEKSGYDNMPFESHGDAEKCIHRYFYKYITIEDTGAYHANQLNGR